MKKELLELLPRKENEETTKNDTEIAEDFFKNSTQLRNAITFEEEGVYSVSMDFLKNMDCPIKRKNGTSYWEAFFIFLGFEYCPIRRKGRIRLIVR